MRLSSLILTFSLLLVHFSSNNNNYVNSQGLVMENAEYIPGEYIIHYREESLVGHSVTTITNTLFALISTLFPNGLQKKGEFNNVFKGAHIKIGSSIQELTILNTIKIQNYVQCVSKNQRFKVRDSTGVSSSSSSDILEQIKSHRQRMNKRLQEIADAVALQCNNGNTVTLPVDPSEPPTSPSIISSDEFIPTWLKRTNFINNGDYTETITDSIGIAVLDTGIDLNHPDLVNVVEDGINCINPNTPAQDDHGHGTRVAGILAAQNNGNGIIGGLNSDNNNNIKLYSVKIADSTGYASLSSELCGIEWIANNAITNNIKIASISISGPGLNDNSCGSTNCDLLHQAICHTTSNNNINFVTSAGNYGQSFIGLIPANYKEVLTVTSYNDYDGVSGSLGNDNSCDGSADDQPSLYSNYASTADLASHTIMAPGSCINTTDLSTNGYINGNGYIVTSGTSFSTPIVSAALALCLQNECKDKNTAEIIEFFVQKNKQYNIDNPSYSNVDLSSNQIYYGPLVRVP